MANTASILRDRCLFPHRPQSGTLISLSPGHLILKRLGSPQRRCFTNPPNRALVDAVRDYAAGARAVDIKGLSQAQAFVRLPKQARTLQDLFFEDFESRAVREKMSYPRSVLQTFRELNTILEADKARVTPFWTAEEREALESWLKAEYKHRVRLRVNINLTYVGLGVSFLAGLGIGYLVFGSS